MKREGSENLRKVGSQLGYQIPRDHQFQCVRVGQLARSSQALHLPLGIQVQGGGGLPQRPSRYAGWYFWMYALVCGFRKIVVYSEVWRVLTTANVGNVTQGQGGGGSDKAVVGAQGQYLCVESRRPLPSTAVTGKGSCCQCFDGARAPWHRKTSGGMAPAIGTQSVGATQAEHEAPQQKATQKAPGGRAVLAEGGGSGTQKCVYQKWPDQTFPMANLLFFPRWSLWSGGRGGGVQGGGGLLRCTAILLLLCRAGPCRLCAFNSNEVCLVPRGSGGGTGLCTAGHRRVPDLLNVRQHATGWGDGMAQAVPA